MRTRADVEEKIKAHPVSGPPNARRAAFRALAEVGPEGEHRMIGGVHCRTFGQGPPVIWLHGGGYAFGDGESHAACAAALAEIGAFEVIVPEYRLAPKFIWPAQREDALAVVEAVGLDTPLVGDSAGGHLALVLATQSAARPRRLALISPNTDRTGLSDMRAAHSARDLMNDDEQDRALARQAFSDRRDDDPEVSPVLADLSRLPPTYLTASRTEVLAGDAALLEAKARQQGAEVTLEWVPDLFHMWTLWPTALPEARATLTCIADHLAAK